jgi:flagellar basal-body rod modification protein FlgD
MGGRPHLGDGLIDLTKGKTNGGNMAAISGVLNHNSAAAQALSATSATSNAAASNTSSKSSASTSAATISSNDFLTLLVTEMKNQDPTSTADPNEYINQLVNVNSLEQLISINQTLSTDLAPSTTASSTPSTAQAGTSGAAQASVSGSNSGAGQSATAKSGTSVPDAISTAAAQLAPGNLALPAVNQAAQSVAQSLSGRSRVQ